jgi:uncharacterized protein YecT (DUF1311 family)
MRILASSMLLLFLLLVSTSAQRTKKPEPCQDAQSQAEMNICWGKEYKKADTVLNQVYRQLVEMLDDEQKSQLKEAQTAWLKYRDLNCEFAADQYKGGSMRPMIHAICLTDVTNNRTTELRSQISDRNQD